MPSRTITLGEPIHVITPGRPGHCRDATIYAYLLDDAFLPDGHIRASIPVGEGHAIPVQWMTHDEAEHPRNSWHWPDL